MDCKNCKHCEIIESGNYKLNDGTLILAKGNIQKCKLEKVKSITITDGEFVCSNFEEDHRYIWERGINFERS